MDTRKKDSRNLATTQVNYIPIARKVHPIRPLRPSTRGPYLLKAQQWIVSST